MFNLNKYFPNQNKWAVKVNLWDIIALFLVLGLIIVLASGTKEFAVPFHVGQQIPITLDPGRLPEYALQTVLRMMIALVFALLFTFIFGAWAAKSKQAEKIIIPTIDILQSVPVLAFLSLTIVGFIKLFPGSLLGPQCACIFLIFTAQAWNMALSFYQSLRTVPEDFKEAATMFHLSAWQRFWRVDVPFSMPGLLWNMMMSMSASWFSLVASEAISVSNQQISLPGIGSYIALAIQKADVSAVFYAIIAMLVVIILYDQLLFRPLISWSEKFKAEQTAQEKPARSWVISLLQRTQVVKYLGGLFAIFADAIVNLTFIKHRKRHRETHASGPFIRHLDWYWNAIIAIAFMGALYLLIHFIAENLSLDEVKHVFFLGTITAARVLVLIILCSLIWVPVGVWIGLRPQAAEIVQPIAQFLAAFPANLLFPVVVLGIVAYNLNVEIWTTPLMILGTQWYVLFNVIAGTSAIPKDLKQAADSFGLRGWLWWRRLILPSIFPYYITGAMTAGGGAWNASLVAEVVSWGQTSLKATGLGAYVTEHTGHYAKTVLGVAVMSLFVLILNYLIWRPLYAKAVSRFTLD